MSKITIPPAALEAGAAVQWRPIKEAPKDGSRILLRIGNLVGSGRFGHPHAWGITDNDGFYCDGADLPSGATHWMPLPPPPQQERPAMSDLVERLRALQHFDVCYPVPHPTCEEAATRIEKLEAEVKVWQGHAKTAIWSDSEECKFLTARIEQLEAALRPLACTCEVKHGAYCSRSEVDCPFWHARAALGEDRT